MAQFFVSVPKRGLVGIEHFGVDVFERFKSSGRAAERIDGGWFQVAMIPRQQGERDGFFRSAGGRRWLCSSGNWFHGKARVRSAEALLAEIEHEGIDRVARELEGAFVVLVGDEHTRTLTAITDRFGTAHAFVTDTGNRVLLSTSSAALGAAAGRAVDPIGLREFVATGIIYGDRSLWSDVRKLPPAALVSLGASGMAARRYWTLDELSPEQLRLDEAVEATGDALGAAAARIAHRFDRPVADLTGGYDSRATLCAFLSTGQKLATTVSGQPSCADVAVSREIAQAFHLPHHYIEPLRPPDLDSMLASVRATDGEYEAEEYARVLQIHEQLATRFDASINGSFGEVARGYWWELLFPKIGARAPLDTRRIVRKRFVRESREGFGALLADDAGPDLQDVVGEAATEAIAGLGAFPNTTQLDALYLRMRMQRWQGRIASATDHLWPCVSPFAFPSVLVPVLQTRWRARIYSRLIKHLVHRRKPSLGRVDLEHGYPLEPVRLTNVHRFAPYVGNIAARVHRKLHRPASAGAAGSALADALPWSGVDDPALDEFARLEHLTATGVVRATQDVRRHVVPGPAKSRLLTVEVLLRELDRARSLAAGAAPRGGVPPREPLTA